MGEEDYMDTVVIKILRPKERRSGSYDTLLLSVERLLYTCFTMAVFQVMSSAFYVFSH
jgi:hypothetical protein